MRSSTILTLGKLGDQRALQPIIEALQDEEHYVRCSAAEALGEIGDDLAILHLIDALNDDERSRRE